MNPDGSVKGYQSESVAVTRPGFLYSLNTLGDTNADGRLELAFGSPLQGGIFEPRGIVQILTLEKATAHTAAPATPTIDRSATMTSSLTQSTGAPVELTWSAVSGANRYDIWIMDDRDLTTY